MHLVSSRGDLTFTPFYRKERNFARAYSLPYIFRKLRIHRDLTKDALGKKLGFSEKYVSEVEDGSRLPSLKFCLRCASEFNANPNWVKVKWHAEAVEHISARLKRQLGLDD